MNDEKRQVIYQLGLKTGVLDDTLSEPDNWMTDYGSCKEQLLAFARGVAECEREREIATLTRWATLCESGRGGEVAREMRLIMEAAETVSAK